MLANRKIAESHKTIRGSTGRYLYVLMMMFVLLVIAWEESGLQRWMYNELMQGDVNVLMSSGENWQVWDKQNPIHGNHGIDNGIDNTVGNESTAVGSDGNSNSNSNNAEYVCDRWIRYGRTELCVSKEAEGTDTVLEVFRRGFSQQCRTQVRQQWNKNHPNRNFVEIGGTDRGDILLGAACVLEMVQSTTADSNIVVFESNPIALFSLTESLLRASPQYRERVTLFPIALGQERGGTLRYPGTNTTVPSERLDEVLSLGSGGAQVLHMRHTGHECDTLRGMPIFLQQTQSIHLHIDPSRECSVVSLLEESKFRLSRFQGSAGRLRAIPKNPGSGDKQPAHYYALARNRRMKR